MLRSLGFGMVGTFVLMTAAVAATPAVSRPSPTPSLRPPTASARPVFDTAFQPRGGGGGGPRGGPGIGGGRGGPGIGGGIRGGPGIGGPGIRIGIGAPGIGIGIGPGGFGPGGFGPGGFGRGGFGPGGFGGPFPPSYPYYYQSQRIPVIESVEVVPTQSALRITDIYDGAAKRAALREGDVIVSVGKTRVQTFNELALTLANVTGPVEVTYLQAGTNKVEKTMVTPVDGKIGVGVVPVDVR